MDPQRWAAHGTPTNRGVPRCSVLWVQHAYNPCTSDSCDPKLGVRHEPVAAGTSCGTSDNVCNGAPVCNLVGECVAGSPLDCDDGNACNGTERCNAQTGCVAGPPPSCDDQNACNGVEHCDDSSGCSSGTLPTITDANLCTIDACDPDLGVTHINAPDGTPCGTEHGCENGECIPFR